MKFLFPLLFGVLFLSGCYTVAQKRAGESLLKFWTWGSTSEADQIEKTSNKITEKTKVLLQQALEEAVASQMALAAAPESRPVSVARESIDTTVSILDQVAGPLTFTEKAVLQSRIKGLLSENEKIRAVAQSELSKNRELIASATEEMDRLREESNQNMKKAKDAIYREAEIANKHRGMIFWIWAAAIGYVFFAFILPVLSRAFPLFGAASTFSQSVLAPFAVAAARKSKEHAFSLAGAVLNLRNSVEEKGILDKNKFNEITNEWVTEADGTMKYADDLLREKGHL